MPDCLRENPTMTELSLAEALRGAQAALPRLDAQMLLLHVLGRSPHDRAWLMSHDQDLLAADQLHRYRSLCQRRAEGEPLSYLTGYKAFYGLDLRVGPAVLDPRPDTETLVDWALQCLPGTAPARVLDLGTGSGAIALALAHARPGTQVLALERSPQALALAQANAQRLRLPVHCAHSHWFSALDSRQLPPPWSDPVFELIVSNPPYIAAHDPHLAALRHEPSEALVSGADGLDDLRHIIARAGAWLCPGGWLLLEHGHDQAPAVQQLMAQAGWQQVQSRQDLAGIARCTGGRQPAQKAE